MEAAAGEVCPARLRPASLFPVHHLFGEMRPSRPTKTRRTGGLVPSLCVLVTDVVLGLGETSGTV
uniref:Uncharacterized protein n=1 Tax=Leersia perrieri TaxID=77586 RepID=A0A0D9VDV4_9ORYZ